MPRTFEQWKAELEAIVIEKTGMPCDAFEDWYFMRSYEEGLSPKAAANAFLKYIYANM